MIISAQKNRELIEVRNVANGIMTEALTEILRYCFEKVGFDRINGSHAAENIGSSRVMEKCGFVYEFLCRDNL